MRLVYTKTGEEVKVGDRVTLRTGVNGAVHYFTPPHKPASSGFVIIKEEPDGFMSEFYVSVIGAEWIERKDRDETVITSTEPRKLD